MELSLCFYFGPLSPTHKQTQMYIHNFGHITYLIHNCEYCVTNVLRLQILHADFDEEDTAFLLTVSIAKAGVTQPAKTMNKAVLAKTAVSRMKEKTKPKEPPKEKPKEKPKPKETVKEKPREEAYFETEEYEVCFKYLWFSYTIAENCLAYFLICILQLSFLCMLYSRITLLNLIYEMYGSTFSSPCSSPQTHESSCKESLLFLLCLSSQKIYCRLGNDLHPMK